MDMDIFYRDEDIAILVTIYREIDTIFVPYVI